MEFQWVCYVLAFLCLKQLMVNFTGECESDTLLLFIFLGETSFSIRIYHLFTPHFEATISPEPECESDTLLL